MQLSNTETTQYSYNSGFNANGTAIRCVVPHAAAARHAQYRFDEHGCRGAIAEVPDSSGSGFDELCVGSAACGAVLATQVCSCRFIYDPHQGATQQNGLASLQLELSRRGEPASPLFGAHVVKTP